MDNFTKIVFFIIFILLINFSFAYDSKYFNTNFEFSKFSTSSVLNKADKATELIANTLGLNPIKFYLVQDTSEENYSFGSKRLYYDYTLFNNESELLDIILPMVAEEYLYQLDNKYGEFHRTWFGQGLSETLKNLAMKKQNFNVSDWEEMQNDIVKYCSNQVEDDLQEWSYGYTCYGDTCLNATLIEPYGGYCPSYPSAKRDTILYYASSHIVTSLFDSNIDKISLFFKSVGKCNAELDWGWDGENVLYEFPNRNIRYHSIRLSTTTDHFLSLGGLKYEKFESYEKQISDFNLFLNNTEIPKELFSKEKDLSQLETYMCKGEYQEISKEIDARVDKIKTDLNVYSELSNQVDKIKSQINLSTKFICWI